MKKVLAIGLGLFLCMMTIQASATTPEDIEESILKGIAWLLEQQNEDGSFADWEKVACTAFAVVKLEDRAFELGMSPFNEVYEYSQNVTAGLNYIFSQADTYEGTNGICFGKGRHVSYHTGIAMMAIAAGRDPDRVVNVPGSIVHGWTYKEVLQAKCMRSLIFFLPILMVSNVLLADTNIAVDELRSLAEALNDNADNDTQRRLVLSEKIKKTDLTVIP